MNNIFLILLISTTLGCINRSAINSETQKRILASKFRTRCDRDSCYTLTDSIIIKKIKNKIKELHSAKLVRYANADNEITTDGNSYWIFLYDISSVRLTLHSQFISR
jgi:hypothetical protein